MSIITFCVFIFLRAISASIIPERCIDEHENCPAWAADGLCDPSVDNGYMKLYCRKSCSFCLPVETTNGAGRKDIEGEQRESGRDNIEVSNESEDVSRCPNNQVWYTGCAPCYVTCKGTMTCRCSRNVCGCPRDQPVSIGAACVTFDMCDFGYSLCRYRGVPKGLVLPQNDIQPREQYVLLCSRGYTREGNMYATCGYDGKLLQALGRCVRSK